MPETPGKDKSEFWWASIAGADCEPVEVTKLNGERVAYTCGCTDPFYLDRPDCPVLLIPVNENEWLFFKDKPPEYQQWSGRLARPFTPRQEELNLKAERKRQETLRSHGWRGPR